MYMRWTEHPNYKSKSNESLNDWKTILLVYNNRLQTNFNILNNFYFSMFGKLLRYLFGSCQNKTEKYNTRYNVAGLSKLL